MNRMLALDGPAFAPVVAMSLVSLVAAFGNPYFLVNDNLTYAEWSAAGLMSPSLGAPVSWLVHSLTKVFGAAVNWYGATLYACLTGAIALVLDGVRRLPLRRRDRLTISIVAAFIFAPFAFRLDYTATAILLAAAGLFWFAAATQNGAQLRHGATLAAAISLAAMIRHQAPFAALSIAAPLLVFCSAARESTGLTAVRRVAGAAFLLIACISIGVASVVVDHAVKRRVGSDAYAAFVAFNDVRGALHGTAFMALEFEEAELERRVGWTMNDFHAFRRWLFVDETTYNVQALSAFRELASDVSRRAGAQSNMTLKARNWRGGYLSFAPFIALCVVYVFALQRDDRNLQARLWSIAATIGAAGCVAFILARTVRFPPQVGWAFLAAALVFVAAIVVTGRTSPAGATNRQGILLLTGIAGAISIWLAVHADILRSAAASHAAFDAQARFMNTAFDGDFVLIEPAAGLEVKFLHPLAPERRRFATVHTGWTTFSPLFYRQLAENSLSSGADALIHLIDNQNAFLVGDFGYAKLLVQQLNERSHENVRAILCRDYWTSDRARTFQLTTSGQKPGADPDVILRLAKSAERFAPAICRKGRRTA
ncbi:MAG: hypothetical protein GC152_06740 [Alphaproteobacteria bacterium]|nr:hypothetical protein [Alphaproteobacteria bacterium]